MLDVRRLRLLRELAHRGTIAAVAEALAFTPSAVSQQLSVLEREAGLPLLERRGRRVVLTPAGQNLVRHAEAVLEQLERASAELAGARRGLSGPLRIGTFPSAGRTLIPAAIAALAREHPGLEPMISEIDPAGVAAALRAGELDVALIHEYDFAAAGPEPGLATADLCTEAMYLAAAAPAPGDPAVTRATADASDNPRRDADHRTPGTMCQQMTIRSCQAAGFTPRTRHQVDDFATTLSLVAAGQGMALVPQLGAAGPPPGVVLTRVPLARRTRIAYRRGAGAHPAVAAVAGLRERCPEPIQVTPGSARGRSAAPSVILKNESQG
jgi:DNA-binding transcriptional LysR family regulator